MNKLSRYAVFLLFVLSLVIAGANQQAPAQDAPRLSSSLAKNLWRQAHFYFDEGMDAKAIRACEELQAWARENNEPAVEKKMSDMLATLHARQQAPPAAKSTTKETASTMQNHLPACGHGSENAIPGEEALRIVTRTPGEFLSCQRDQDCAVAIHFCGNSRAINKPSKACYEAAVRRFDKNTGCTGGEPFDAAAVCRNQTCMLQF